MQIKAVVIRHPFWAEIANGLKTIEYRSWNTNFRGWLAVVAARQRESGQDAGRIVCFVPLVDCVRTGESDYEWLLGKPILVSQRVEIPGRLGLFDVTDMIPERLKTLLAPDTAACVNEVSKRRKVKDDGSIHAAAKVGNLKRVKAMIEADPKLALAKDEHGKTALSYATSGGFPRLYAYLWEIRSKG